MEQLHAPGRATPPRPSPSSRTNRAKTIGGARQWGARRVADAPWSHRRVRGADTPAGSADRDAASSRDGAFAALRLVDSVTTTTGVVIATYRTAQPGADGGGMTERLTIWSSRRPWLTLAGWGLALVAADRAQRGVPRRRAVRRRGAHERYGVEARRRAGVRALCRRARPARAETRPRWSSFAPRRRPWMSRASERRVEVIAAELRASRCDSSHHLLRHGRAAAGLPGSRCHRDARRPRPRRRGRDRGRRRRRAGRRRPRRDSTPRSPASSRSTPTSRRWRRRTCCNGELGFGLPAALIVLLIVFGSVVAGLIPVAAVARLDHRRARADGARRAGFSALGLRHQHAHRDGPRARDRLLAVHPLPLPRGARSRAGEARRDRRRPAPRPAERCCSAASRSRSRWSGSCSCRSTIMRSLAAGAIAAGLVSVAAALTLLPALLEPARRSRQRAAHPVLRADRGPRAEPLLVARRCER